jgi:hypothetical protein
MMLGLGCFGATSTAVSTASVTPTVSVATGATVGTGQSGATALATIQTLYPNASYVSVTGVGTLSAPANGDVIQDGNGNVLSVYLNGGWSGPSAPITLSAYETAYAAANPTSSTGPTFSQGLALWETPSTAFSALGSLSFASANLAYAMGVLVPPVAAVGLLLMMMNGGKR